MARDLWEVTLDTEMRIFSAIAAVDKPSRYVSSITSLHFAGIIFTRQNSDQISQIEANESRVEIAEGKAAFRK